jgi:hypothetical protein
MMITCASLDQPPGGSEDTRHRWPYKTERVTYSKQLTSPTPAVRLEPTASAGGSIPPTNQPTGGRRRRVDTSAMIPRRTRAKSLGPAPPPPHMGALPSTGTGRGGSPSPPRAPRGAAPHARTGAPSRQPRAATPPRAVTTAPKGSAPSVSAGPRRSTRAARRWGHRDAKSTEDLCGAPCAQAPCCCPRPRVRSYAAGTSSAVVPGRPPRARLSS